MVFSAFKSNVMNNLSKKFLKNIDNFMRGKWYPCFGLIIMSALYNNAEVVVCEIRTTVFSPWISSWYEIIVFIHWHFTIYNQSLFCLIYHTTSTFLYNFTSKEKVLNCTLLITLAPDKTDVLLWPNRVRCLLQENTSHLEHASWWISPRVQSTLVL